MEIILNWDSSVTNAPAGFKPAVEYAANLYESIFTSPITVTFDIGYGRLKGNALGVNNLGEATQGTNYVYTYSQVVDALLTVGGVAATQLPAADPTGGAPMALSISQAVALGLAADSPTIVAGYVGFSSTARFNYSTTNRAVLGEYDFVGVAEHELAHALARTIGFSIGGVKYWTIEELYRYQSPGSIAVGSAGRPYFSLDRGATVVNYFNSGTEADWLYSPGSKGAYNAAVRSSVENLVSASDVLVMNALGFSTVATLVGTGSDFVGNGEQDKFLRSGSGQLINWQYDSTGALTSGLAFTDASGNPINISPSTTVVATGSNFLGAGGRDVFTLDGAGRYQVFEINSGGTVIASSSQSEVHVTAPGAAATSFNGSGESLALGSGTALNLSGNSNSIRLGANSYVGLLGGKNNIVSNHVAGASVNLTSNATAVITGSGGYFGIIGTNITVTASDANAATIAGASFNLAGNNNLVSLGAKAYVGLLGGTNNTVFNNIAGASVNLTSNATAVINGKGGYFGIIGTNITVTASGENAATIAGASFNLAGNNNLIRLGASSYVGLLGGTNNTVFNNVTGASVNLTSNATAVINGKGGYFGIIGSNITVAASGQNVATIAGASFNLAGNNNLIRLGANSYVGLLGGSGSLVAGAGAVIQTLANTHFNIDLDGGTNTVTLGAGSDFGIVGSSGGIRFISGPKDNLAILATPGAQDVAGFNMANGDQLDLRQILAGASLAPNLMNLSNYISVKQNGMNTILGIKGSGGVDTVTMVGVGPLSLQNLIHGNAFVLPPY